MWKVCGKGQFPHSFGRIAEICGNCAFPKNLHKKKLGEIAVFYEKPGEKEHKLLEKLF